MKYAIPELSMKHIEGVGPTMAWEIACHDCRKSLPVPRPKHVKMNSDTEIFAYKRITRCLAERGWEWNKNLKHCVCPECLEQRRKNRRTPAMDEANKVFNMNNVKRMNAVQEPEPAQNPEPKKHADEPRKPTAADRRKIADMLESVYITAQQMYSGCESDDSVAKVLSVPRAWVSEVRGMLFGDHDRNEKSAAREEEIIKLEKRLDDVWSEAKRLADDIKALRLRS